MYFVLLYQGPLLLMKHSKKFQVQLRNEKVPGNTCITTVSKKKFEKISDDDDGGFQQQSPQRLINEYEHMNGRNERWTMRLKVVPLA